MAEISVGIDVFKSVEWIVSSDCFDFFSKKGFAGVGLMEENNFIILIPETNSITIC